LEEGCGVDGKLKERVAVVTGASGGIGRATCCALVREGAKVVAVGRDPTRLDETVEMIDSISPCSAFGLQLDVRSPSDMEDMVERTLERFGGLDILVASAGILRPPGRSFTPLWQMSVTDWDAVMKTNLRGTFLSNRAVLPQMIQQRGGDIVNVSSKSGRKGLAFDSAYCGSKCGIIGMTQALAKEAEPFGVRVQVVLPGTFDTALWDQNPAAPRPAGLPPPDRVAELIVAIVSLPNDVQVLAPLVEPLRTLEAASWLKRA